MNGLTQGSLFRRLFPVFALSILSACQSSGNSSGAKCELRRGMTTAELVTCGCEMTGSGGAAITVGPEGAPGRSVTVADYVCPQGKAGVAGAYVVDGVVQEISR